MLDSFLSPASLLPVMRDTAITDPLLNSNADPEERIKAVAASFEEMLILNLVKNAFREEQKDKDNSFSLGGDFKALHNQMLARYIAENGGLGLQESISTGIREKVSNPSRSENSGVFTLARKTDFYPAAKPLRPVNGAVTSDFGWRRDPFSGRPSFHRGIDLRAPIGTEVQSSLKGVVVYSGRKQGYGNLLRIRHANGIETAYAHLSEILVGKDQQVQAGQLVALSGSEGRSTGPHLHFEVLKNGRHIDPTLFLSTFGLNEKLKKADLTNGYAMEVQQ